MGSFDAGTILYVKSDGDNLEIRNCDPAKAPANCRLVKLTDFFTSGIGVDSSKISSLQLENCALTDLPRSFQHLNLKQLILSRNKLSEVPCCLYLGLKALEVLDLSHNSLKSFDIEPGCSQSLVTLKLGNNHMKNFPCWVLTLPCPNLVEVDYKHNRNADMKPTRRLGLKRLIMSNSLMLDFDYGFLKGLEALESLDISNDDSCRDMNRFNYIDKLFLKPKWKYLKILILNNLPISIVPTDIFQIQSLVELHLVKCVLNWIPECVELLINLEVLDVSRNAICSISAKLANLPKLRVVKAPFNYISSVAAFANDLEILDLYSNYLEKIPSAVDRTQYIDLEKNFMDMSLYENYSSYALKKDKLRQMFDFIRSDGYNPNTRSPDFISDTESVASYESYSEDDDYQNEQVNSPCNESECWDDEEPIQVILPKNPEVTTSDDEWDGKEEDKTNNNSSKKSVIVGDPDEDLVFVDVEQN